LRGYDGECNVYGNQDGIQTGYQLNASQYISMFSYFNRVWISKLV